MRVDGYVRRRIAPEQRYAVFRFMNKAGDGLTIFLTGLSGAGKSTIAMALLADFAEHSSRPVTLLDGDVVRKILSSELGYSREHRDLNVLRIGYVASEITRHGGIAVCAVIAPYAAARKQVRELVSGRGRFVEVYVATPLDVCEQRDPKGLYAKARAGSIPGFTGVSDPYEPPAAPEVTIDTRRLSPRQAAALIVSYLGESGWAIGDEPVSDPLPGKHLAG